MILNKKFSFGLTAANPFANFVGQRSTTFGSSFSTVNIRQVPVRSFGISLSYKFGKLEFKKENKEKEEDNMNTPDAPPEKESDKKDDKGKH
jgi:hypothetical protein